MRTNGHGSSTRPFQKPRNECQYKIYVVVPGRGHQFLSPLGRQKLNEHRRGVAGKVFINMQFRFIQWDNLFEQSPGRFCEPLVHSPAAWSLADCSQMEYASMYSAFFMPQFLVHLQRSVENQYILDILDNYEFVQGTAFTQGGFMCVLKCDSGMLPDTCLVFCRFYASKMSYESVAGADDIIDHNEMTDLIDKLLLENNSS